MQRRKFINTMVRWSLLIFLAGLSVMLGKKIVLEKNCSSCPDYASCPGTENCNILRSKNNNG